MHSLHSFFGYFHIPKWLSVKQTHGDLICKYFVCYIVFQFFCNNSKAKLLVRMTKSIREEREGRRPAWREQREEMRSSS